MLPKLTQSFVVTPSQANSRVSRSSAKPSTKTGLEKAINYEQKYQSQVTLNLKLKTLLKNMKSNVELHAQVNEQENEIAILMKEKKKWQHDAQHQAHILNLLISDNNKLKDLVEAERNKRAIYFNIYKDLEHEISEWEEKYKNVLIESMITEGVIKRVRQKFVKATKKLQKEVQMIKIEISSIGKQQVIQIGHESLLPPKQQQESKQKKNRRSSFMKFEGIKNQSKSTSVSSEQQNFAQQKKMSSFNPANKIRQSSDYEYEIEEKTIQIEGIMKRLMKIYQKSDINQCQKVYQSIDSDIEYNFDLFKGQQFREKQLSGEIQKITKIMNIAQHENIQQRSTFIPVEGHQKLCCLQAKIREIEMTMSAKMDINVSQLTNEMIIHQCIRSQEQRKDGKRSLQKCLQSSKKQKSEYNLLLNPQQMQKIIVQNQVKMRSV